MATHTVVTIVGSLRKESFTLKIANALAKLAPDMLKLNVTTLHDISFFNQDLEAAPPRDGALRIVETTLTIRDHLS
jgi:chromate reductase